jgi:hypothetical protein
MKRSIVARLRSNGFYYVVSALFILVVAPLYQIVVLGPTGFGAALSATSGGHYAAYLAWIGAYTTDFIIYRAILIIAFALLISFPFALYRIIIAQEIMAQQEQEHESPEETETGDEVHTETESEETGDEAIENDSMPAYAWRGKGFAVLAAWLGLIGISIYILSAIASTLYTISAGNPYATGAAISTVTTFFTIFTISTNTVGTGLLGLGILFFGAMIARTGRNLWPDIWANFGYAALFVAALLCISAIGVVSAPGAGQSTLTTIATLLFAIWVLWLGTMLIRLKPEA